MPPKRAIKLITTDLKARERLLAGAAKVYKAVSATFGAMSGNVLLEKPYGDPIATHDGVTVARDIFLRDAIENMGARVLVQASAQTNKLAGDGTTATVILGYNLLKEAHKRVVAGESAMELKRTLEADSKKVIDYLLSKSKEAGSKELLEVATISSGDSEIGALISNVVEEVGNEGSITLREDLIPGIKVEEVGGYYFDKGFFALNIQVEYEKPHILVTQKRLVSAHEMLPIIKTAIETGNKRVVIIGDISGDALNTAVGNIMNGNWECVVVPPPAFGDDAKLFLEDVAIYTNAKLFYEGDRMDKMTPADFGAVERSQVNQDRAILFNASNDEPIDGRIKELKAALEAESNANKRERIEQRIAKLSGKISIVKVGGNTQSEMEELKFRVEDAIEATKSALAEGVLPGNATALVWASEELDVHPLLKQALQAPFIKLLDNAGQSGEFRLNQILKAGWAQGFNVREMDTKTEPKDLLELGVLDATKAIVQTVINAVSAANVLLTTNATVSIDDRDDTSKSNTSKP